MKRFLSLVVLISAAACSATAPIEDGEEPVNATSQEALMACGWLTGGTCTKLPWGNWRAAEYWGDFYAAKYHDKLQYALQNIEEGPTPLAEPRAVLLITGVTIKAEWMEPIAARLKRDGFIPYIYEPPGLLSGNLFVESAALDGVVDQVRAETGQDKIDILAECTGGVIARHYIQSHGGDAKISRMVTFVSPQHGLPMAPLVHKLVGWPALKDLTPNSPFMRAVNDVPLPDTVKFTSIYTCTDEYIQPYKTSFIPGATNINLCQGFTGHFQTMYDPAIYLIMHDALTK